MVTIPTFRETLKQTTSRCPQCHIACPASVWKTTSTPSKVHLTRTCPDHGEATITGVLDRKGNIEILQLSGGEPTLHPQLFELLDWIHDEPRIDYTLVNTNVIRSDGKLDSFCRYYSTFPDAWPNG